MKTKALCLCLLLAAPCLVPPVAGQALIDGAEVAPAERDKTFFINRLMRQVVIPANAPANPDVIPLGYQVEMPDTSAARVAERGDHFWLFTSDLVDRYRLYEKWTEAGKPVPVGEFATAALPSEANLVMDAPAEPDTAQAAAPPPADPAEPEVVDVPWWRSTFFLVIVLLFVLLLAAAFMWSRRRREEEASASRY